MGYVVDIAQFMIVQYLQKQKSFFVMFVNFGDRR